MPYVYILCVRVRQLPHDVYIVKALGTVGLRGFSYLVGSLLNVIVMYGADLLFVLELQAEDLVLGF